MRGVALVLCGVLFAGSVAVAAPKPPVQVAAAVLVTAAPSLAGFEAARCAWLAGGKSSPGTLGHMIALPRGTYDGHGFVLRAINDALV